MSDKLPTWERLTTAAHNARPLMPVYLHLLVSALFPIYTGAYASLSRPSSAAKPEKKDRDTATEDEDEDDEEAVQKMEGLSPQDAILFPLSAGCVLGGLYFLIKRYGAELINLILGWYFSGVGVYSVAKLLNDGANILLSLLFPIHFASHGKLWRAGWREKKVIQVNPDGKEVTRSNDQQQDSAQPWLINPRNKTIWSLATNLRQKYTTKAYIHSHLDFRANLTPINLLSALTSIGIIVYSNILSPQPKWFLTNLQGFAVSYSALQLLSPTSFPTGSLILAGLFCYDIWAVFFTPLMVTVAKNLDQPIKLVFPRPDEPSTVPGEPPTKSFSMLGLGDIVLPGIMIALALRFDLYLFYLKKQKKIATTSSTLSTSNSVKAEGQEITEKAPYISVSGNIGERFWTARLPSHMQLAKLRSSSFSTPYFTASMIGYVLGMLTTLGVMSAFQHAQPALLYLVPGVLGALWGTAVVRGEVGLMWEYVEGVEEEEVEENKGGENGKSTGKEKEDRRSWWQQIKDEVFGKEKEERTSKVKDETGAEVNNGEAANDDKDGKEHTKASSQNETDPNILISFSVKRYTPRPASSASEPAPRSSEIDKSDIADSGKTSTLPVVTDSEEEEADDTPVLVETDEGTSA